MAVYGLFILPTVDGHDNGLLARTLLGIPLGDGLVGLVSSGAVTWGSAAVFAGIMVVIAVVAQASRRLLTPPAVPTSSGPSAGPDLSGLTRALSFLPFMTAVVAAFVPLAAALYLMTTTAWTLGERLVLMRILRDRSAERA
jgi:YidC/Oxa1 family membrane protein insertase